jgi:hypothetical protein
VTTDVFFMVPYPNSLASRPASLRVRPLGTAPVASALMGFWLPGGVTQGSYLLISDRMVTRVGRLQPAAGG